MVLQNKSPDAALWVAANRRLELVGTLRWMAAGASLTPGPLSQREKETPGQGKPLGTQRAGPLLQGRPICLPLQVLPSPFGRGAEGEGFYREKPHAAIPTPGGDQTLARTRKHSLNWG